MTDTTSDAERNREADRLWRAFKRDLPGAILELAGFREGNAAVRLGKTWEKLCALNLDAAAGIHHGIEQVLLLTARHGEPDSPAAHWLRQFERQLDEIAGLAMIARDGNPDVKAETVGELVALAEAEIRRQVDEDTSGTSAS